MPLLWSFQPLDRIAELERTGELVGSWEHLVDGPGDPVRRAYREMVAAMERAGVPTGGRPPVWSWGGRCGVTVQDALMLVGEPLRNGWATVQFDAPARLAFATDYGAWNDHLFALLDGVAGGRPGWEAPLPIAEELVQVCVPVLRAAWVREVRPLPRSEEEVTDWSARA